MKRIYSAFVFFILMAPACGWAQFSISHGDHTFDIGGDLIAGYNYRFYQPGETDFHKNNFILDEARFNFRGRIGNELQYKFEMDLADLIADIQTPATGIGVMKDAYMEYKTKYVNIKTGFSKLPYSLNGLVAEIDDPFLQRPLVVTKVNSRRDLGATLSHSFALIHLNVYAGVYSGMGEQVFSVDNTNGKPEYVGRIEYGYPSKFQQQIVDMRTSPVPVFQVGVNARYKEGTTTTIDTYNLLTVNGKKTSYGIDASVFYKGFSAQFEAHQLHVIPVDSTRLFSEGKTYTYLNAGGYMAELNYYCKHIKSVFAIRYDELNPSDLTFGNTQKTITYAYNYFIHQNFLCVKLQYEQHLNLTYPSGTRWKDDELKAELQVIFN